jgi:hypothetical protein
MVGMEYRYDVFVSYAHADNEVPEGAATKFGWVTTLARNLNVGPNVHKKALFIDHQLKPGDEFSDDLIDKVRSSALLVLLLSQNYIDSEWCGKELEYFIQSHASDRDVPSGVFVVELTPFENLLRVPTNIHNIRKRLIHAKFWSQPADTASPVLAGYPTPAESGPVSGSHYWLVLNELRSAIDSRLRARRSALSLNPARSLQQEAQELLGTVLLADVTDDLEGRRDAVKFELEREGVEVCPDGDYVGLAPKEFEARIETDLRRCDLFVQLLSFTAGRKLKGFAAPLPQLQFLRAAAAKCPIMQWCERIPQPGDIADLQHAELFETEFLSVTTQSEFKSKVIARLQTLKADVNNKNGAHVAHRTRTRPSQKLIFVDDIGAGSAISQKLEAIIRGADCAIRGLPPQASLGGNGINIKEALRPCSAGITICADRSNMTTAYNRLVFFLNQIAEAELPVARWGVYLKQGSVATELGIRSDEVVAFDERTLGAFLQAI